METPVIVEAPVKEKKNTGAIIGTIVAALLCGCPGLAGMCWGAVSAIVSFIPGANIDIGGSSNPTTALLVGLGSLCAGIIFVAIPVVIGVMTLRKKKPALEEAAAAPQEPLPPAS
jgi:hypothetical protein